MVPSPPEEEGERGKEGCVDERCRGRRRHRHGGRRCHRFRSRVYRGVRLPSRRGGRLRRYGRVLRRHGSDGKRGEPGGGRAEAVRPVFLTEEDGIQGLPDAADIAHEPDILRCHAVLAEPVDGDGEDDHRALDVVRVCPVEGDLDVLVDVTIGGHRRRGRCGPFHGHHQPRDAVCRRDGDAVDR